MYNINIQYQELLREILDEGYEYVDTKRDVKCKQIDDAYIRVDLQQGFPVISLKKLWWQGVVGELLWFLRGDTNIKYLIDNNIHIWNKDAYNWYLKNSSNHETEGNVSTFDQFLNKDIDNGEYIVEPYEEWGDLGRVYGAQWRTWSAPYGENLGLTTDDGEKDYLYRDDYIDQISNLIKNLKEQPMSRRHIVTAWNPAELDDMALPPCHWSFEIIVKPLDNPLCVDHATPMSECTHPMCNKDSKFCSADFGRAQRYGFTLKWHQRSCDLYLGIPFNIASYALLAYIIGELTNMKPLKLIGDLSNVHLYENSWEASRKLIKRDPMKYELPKLGIMDHVKSLCNNFHEGAWPCRTFDDLISKFRIKDFKLLDYESYPNIPVEMLAPK